MLQLQPEVVPGGTKSRLSNLISLYVIVLCTVASAFRVIL